MSNLIQPFLAFLRGKRPTSRKGQTLVEYALILAIITLVAVGVFSALGARVVLLFSGIDIILDTAQGS